MENRKLVKCLTEFQNALVKRVEFARELFVEEGFSEIPTTVAPVFQITIDSVGYEVEVNVCGGEYCRVRIFQGGCNLGEQDQLLLCEAFQIKCNKFLEEAFAKKGI